MADTNQCDGCMSGAVLDDEGIHRSPSGNPMMVCQAHKYATPPAVAALADKSSAAIRTLERCGYHYYDALAIGHYDWYLRDKPAAAALRARAVPEGMTADQLLDKFDAQSATVPLGEESETRGKSVYNWRRAIVREMRAMLAASQSATGGE